MSGREAGLNGALRLTAENYVWGLQGLCQFYRLPFNPNFIRQQFHPPYDLLRLQRAATALGLSSGLREVAAAKLPELPVPFLAALKPSDSEAVMERNESSGPSRLSLVIKCDWRTITYLDQGWQHSWSRPLDEFALQFTGMVLLCVPGTENEWGGVSR